MEEDELAMLAEELIGEVDEETNPNAEPPMTDDELSSLVGVEVSQIQTDTWSLLRDQRIASTLQFEHTINYDHKYTDGLSNVIWNMTGPSVDTLSTYMSKIFCSDKDTVVFTPTTSAMEPAADQAMKMVNAVLHKHNPGYKILSRCFKDAGINKNSVIKTTWDNTVQSFEESYENINEEQLELIIADKESQGYSCEITDQETVEIQVETQLLDEFTGEAIDQEITQTMMSVTIKCSYSKGMPKIECLPPEEFLINEGAVDINDTHTVRFVAHRRLMYNSDIQELFPDVDVSDLPSDGGQLEYDYEKQARHYRDGTYETFLEDNGKEATRLKEVIESWIRADRNGDGFAEWRHVFTCGKVLLHDEEWFGALPFSSFSYFPIPHKFYGLSVYDKIRDYERSATALLRSRVDTAVMSNTNRLIADPRTLNMRDLQTVKNGIIRAGPNFDPSRVMVVPSATGAPDSLQVIQLIRQQIISEIGIDPVSGQISTDVEKSGNDATKTSMVIDNASAKIEGYAREFADNTLRDVIWQILMLLVSHADEDSVQMLAESVTPGVPFLMANALPKVMNKADLTAKVGLGHMTGQQKIAAAQSMIQMMQAFAADPQAPLPIPAQSKLELAYELAKGWGYDNPEKLFGSPEMVQQETAKLDAMKQQAMQMQQQQLAIQQQQAQTQQMQVQGQLQLAQQQQQFEQGLELARGQSLTELDKAKATDLQANANKKMAETDKIDTEVALAELGPIDKIGVNL